MRKAGFHQFFYLFVKTPMYRQNDCWVGNYDFVGKPGNLQDPLSFHVVLCTATRCDGGVTTIVYKVPATWVDESFQYFVHPPPDYTVNGLHPWDWGLISFKKRRYPETTWLEHNVADILTETSPSNFPCYFSFH